MNQSLQSLRFHRQRGAALFVALIFLILLTVLGLAAAGSSMLQERMTGGMRNRQLAMMGVESAIRGGEVAVWNLAKTANYSSFGDAMTPCAGSGPANCMFKQDPKARVANPTVQAFRTTRTWSGTSAEGIRTYAPTLTGLGGDIETASLASQPRFIIEDLGRDRSYCGVPCGEQRGARLPEDGPGAPQSRLFRITARSQGGSAQAATRVAESVYSAYGTNNQYNPDANPASP